MHDRVGYAETLDAEDLWDGEDWYESVEDDEIIDDDIDILDEYGEDLDDEFEEDVDDLDEDVDEELVELADAISSGFALTPAEAFGIGKALSQIGRGATKVFEDPTIRQIVATTAPIAGGAVGTVVGGPVGTAVGTSLGAAAGKALAPPAKTAAKAPVARPATNAPAVPATTGATPAAAQGSAAATKALVSSQQPDVVKALLALALGQGGPRVVNGIPVGAVMNMLSTYFAKAAEDADELLYAGEHVPGYLLDADGFLNADPASPSERADALYAALVGAENEYLAEAGLA